MLGSLTGGVHPPGSKGRTAGLPVENLPVSQTLVVPMQQHIGAPARPAVEVGDAVARGTLLGEPGGFVSAAVHSPVSGKVVAIEDRMGAMGRRGACVIVENDGDDRWAHPFYWAFYQVFGQNLSRHPGRQSEITAFTAEVMYIQVGYEHLAQGFYLIRHEAPADSLNQQVFHSGV